MATHTLASGNIHGYNITCNVLGVYVDDTDIDTDHFENNYASYSGYCWNWDSDVKWESWGNTDSDDWCSTWTGAAWWISCIVFGSLSTCLATCWVQPVCTMERCCCPVTCPRVFYIFGLILCILGNVLWTTNDEVCLPSDAFDLNLGVSVDLVIGSCAIIFVTIFCAK